MSAQLSTHVDGQSNASKAGRTVPSVGMRPCRWRAGNWICGAWFVLSLSPGTAAAQANQWLGGPERSLTVAASNSAPTATAWAIKDVWRRPVGGSFSGLSIHGDHAATLTSIDGQDAVQLLDAHTGKERWSYRLGRTRKRAEGAPLGPLSTPAIDERAVYVQALDGRFVALAVAGGELLWEVNLKREFRAYEPGYGFASSPLLLPDRLILLPAGASAAAVVALDRLTGRTLWKTKLSSAAEYSSATWLSTSDGGQIIAMLNQTLAGVSPKDGAVLWAREEEGGGLWTPSVVDAGRVFVPAAERSFVLELDSAKPRQPVEVWTSDVFGGVMGPVVQLNGILIGHHDRRLTGLDATTGRELWRQPEETDGQLLVWGDRLLFLHDRIGELRIMRVTRDGLDTLQRATVMKPARMETPLSHAHGRLYIRSPEEIVALEIVPAPAAPR